MPAILSGRDVVLAAETGSGKTLAYLAPLVSLALRSRQAAAASAEAEAEAPAAEEEAGGNGWPQQAPRLRRRHATAALVLCPNAALCEQVVAAAAALRDPASGAPLAAAAFVSGQAPPPQSLPDIVVSTPGALLSLVDNSGPTYGYEWTRAGGHRPGCGCMGMGGSRGRGACLAVCSPASLPPAPHPLPRHNSLTPCPCLPRAPRRTPPPPCRPAQLGPPGCV